MLRQNMPQLADVDDQELESYSRWAGRCSNRFCTGTMAEIDRMVALIDRNVNSKILFADLVDRMFLSIGNYE